MFVWVRDPSTGHEFDVPVNDWRITAGIFTRVKESRHPPVGRPRPAKPNIRKRRPAAPVESTKESPTDG